MTTAERKVKEHFPAAYCRKRKGHPYHEVWKGGPQAANVILGIGNTVEVAWENALANMHFVGESVHPMSQHDDLPVVGRTYVSKEKRSLGKRATVQEPAPTSFGFVYVLWNDSGRRSRVQTHYFWSRFTALENER